MGKKCDLSVLISVYLWREGERMVRETFVSHHLLTVFQPTEIRTNTGSVSYPKVKGKSKYSRKPGQEPGNTDRTCSPSWDGRGSSIRADAAAATVEHSGK